MRIFKFEMHFHTKESSPCGEVSAKSGVELYQRAGYDGIVVTDHFSKNVFGGQGQATWEEICEKFLKGYHTAKESAHDNNFQVLLGMEIRFPNNDNDFLVYGFGEEFPKQYPWIYLKDLSYLYEVARERNLLIVQAHPFRENCRLAPIEFLHGIEVFNGNPRHDSRNELAEQTANKHGLLKLIGSDFHQEGDISGRYTGLHDIAKTEQELVTLLKLR